jgi:hypothetical protein
VSGLDALVQTVGSQAAQTVGTAGTGTEGG